MPVLSMVCVERGMRNAEVGCLACVHVHSYMRSYNVMCYIQWIVTVTVCL